MSLNKLTPEEEHVIVGKGTERPFVGIYDNFFEKGTYICKRCNHSLYNSSAKFHSGCGWPSFDDQIEGAVKHIPDVDGRRTEIVCSYCGGHLGHVFKDEGFTSKNTRHCVNSISLKFIPELKPTVADTAIFAAGCFWGVQYYFENLDGVLKTSVGYTGGTVEKPTYKEVCNHSTGHLEAIEVVYDSNNITYKQLCQYFFEIHDFSQTNGQGPDIGPQYLSAIFYKNEEQRSEAQSVVNELTKRGFYVATSLLTKAKFWDAEEYHQLYYSKNGKSPYCHSYKKIF